MVESFFVLIFAISKYQSFSISSFQILTPTHMDVPEGLNVHANKTKKKSTFLEGFFFLVVKN